MIVAIRAHAKVRSSQLRQPLWYALALAVASPLASCSGDDNLAPGVLEAAELTQLEQLSPLPAVPPDPTNRVADSAGARSLGQALFFDPAFSGPLAIDSDLGAAGEAGKVSCASCHSGPALDDRRSDPRTVSVGANYHTRNSPPIVNSSYYRWTNWGGRFSTQWELPPVVAESAVILNSSRLLIAHRLFDTYRAQYEAVFGSMDPALEDDLVRFPVAGKPKPAPTDMNPNPPDGAWESMAPDDQRAVNEIFVNYGKAIASYMRILVSEDAPFDSFVAGETDAISAAAQRGAGLFVGKAHCIDCHSSPHFSDDAFHNLGVPQLGTRVPAEDEGRFRDVPPLLSSALSSSGAFSDDQDTGRLVGLTNPMPDAARSAFRTANLRGVALTAPYMHSGQLATLQEVIDFYDAGGGTAASGTKDERLVPLGLSEREKADLVAFLETLSGQPVPAGLIEDLSVGE